MLLEEEFRSLKGPEVIHLGAGLANFLSFCGYSIRDTVRVNFAAVMPLDMATVCAWISKQSLALFSRALSVTFAIAKTFPWYLLVLRKLYDGAALSSYGAKYEPCSNRSQPWTLRACYFSTPASRAISWRGLVGG